MYKVYIIVALLSMLAGCTAQPTGFSRDKEGNLYSHTQYTTEFNALCTGSCVEKYNKSKKINNDLPSHP